MAVCLFLIVYFNVMVYRGIRKWNRSQIRQVQALVDAKIEAKGTYSAFLLTVFLGISTVPMIGILILGNVLPFLRTSTFFRWAETVVLLNSLFNPLLYCYRDRNFKAVWEWLRFGKRQGIQAVEADCTAQYGVKRTRPRHPDPSSSVNQAGNKLVKVEQRNFARTRSQSCGSIIRLDQVPETKVI